MECIDVAYGKDVVSAVVFVITLVVVVVSVVYTWAVVAWVVAV